MAAIQIVVAALVSQLCLTLYDPMDHIPPGSSAHGILQWVLQGIFLTQGLNRSLLHCRQTLLTEPLRKPIMQIFNLKIMHPLS